MWYQWSIGSLEGLFLDLRGERSYYFTLVCVYVCMYVTKINFVYNLEPILQGAITRWAKFSIQLYFDEMAGISYVLISEEFRQLCGVCIHLHGCENGWLHFGTNFHGSNQLPLPDLAVYWTTKVVLDIAKVRIIASQFWLHSRPPPWLHLGSFWGYSGQFWRYFELFWQYSGLFWRCSRPFWQYSRPCT